MTPLEREAADNFIHYLRTLPRLAGYKIKWFEWDANARFRFDYQSEWCATSEWCVTFDLHPRSLLSLSFDEYACYLIKDFDKYERTAHEKRELRTV